MGVTVTGVHTRAAASGYATNYAAGLLRHADALGFQLALFVGKDKIGFQRFVFSKICLALSSPITMKAVA